MAYLSSTRCLEIMVELAELLPGLLDKRIAPSRILPDLDREKMPSRTKGTPVFTGGSIVSLLVTDSAAPPVSLTKDVDAVLEIATHWDFEGLGDALRGAGFVENVSAGVMGVRWIWHGVEVDFMPHQPLFRVFDSNRWFRHLLADAWRTEVLPGRFIWLASADCFLATKFEAFRSRGGGNFTQSKDFGDVLAVINGRMELMDELRYSQPDVLDFLSECASQLLGHQDFLDTLPRLAPEPGRETFIQDRLLRIAERELAGGKE